MGKCVAADTLVVDPATGELRTAASAPPGRRGGDVSVLTLDGGRVVETQPSAFVDDGIKPVRVRTSSGREVRTTASHLFLTPEGWQPLADLAPGRLVGVPATIPVFGTLSLPADEVVLLAHLVMAPGEDEGCPKLWTENREVASDIEYRGRFRAGVTDRSAAGGGRTWDVVASPELVGLARRHDIAPALEARRVPAAVFRLPRDLLARFLNRALGVGAALWRPLHGEPGAWWSALAAAGGAGLGTCCCASASWPGCASRWWPSTRRPGPRPGGRRAGPARGPGRPHRPARPRGRAGRSSPTPAWSASVPPPRPPRPPTTPGARSPPTPSRAPRPAGDGADVADDVLWDEIVAVEHEGDEQVYDLTVPGTHNFVAADVFVHNTSFALGMGAHAALHANRPVLLFSLGDGRPRAVAAPAVR